MSGEKISSTTGILHLQACMLNCDNSVIPGRMDSRPGSCGGSSEGETGLDKRTGTRVTPMGPDAHHLELLHYSANYNAGYLLLTMWLSLSIVTRRIAAMTAWGVHILILQHSRQGVPLHFDPSKLPELTPLKRTLRSRGLHVVAHA